MIVVGQKLKANITNKTVNICECIVNSCTEEMHCSSKGKGFSVVNVRPTDRIGLIYII